ncbi:NUDIX hydrolase [Candidatus Woesearchaeota archaeon]|nr:NUDIX hydrolase [Candidatus Woesearchaeota archaeon]
MKKLPGIAVDIIIKYQGGIVLIKRKNHPYGWAIPGGFVDYGETLEKAAVREAKEETNLKVKLLRQFHAYSDPKRDPRGHTIGVIFIAKGSGKLKGKDDAVEAKVFTKKKLPKLAFDHKKILKDFFSKRY